MSGSAAIFLDRDGVINRERGRHTWRKEDFEVLPGVAEGLRLLTARGYLRVVITNQSGVGLGLYTTREVEELHAYLHAMLAGSGSGVTDIFYCPHHPSRGRCLCRKPGGLLLEKAIARYGIDPDRSVMIGDRERDVEAARSVGVRGVLVPANASLLDTLNDLNP